MKDKATIELLFHIILTITLLSLMYYLGGEVRSLSTYATMDETRFWFKIWVFLLALGAARNSQFRYSAFPLLGLGMFDTETNDFLTKFTHNVCALLFFGLTTYFLFGKKRSQIFGVLIILGTPIVVYSIYWAEIAFVSVIISYLIFILIRKYKIRYEKNNKRNSS